MNREQRRAAERQRANAPREQQERTIESRVGIAADGKRVILAFSAPIHNLIMTPSAAVEHATMLINTARMIEPDVVAKEPVKLELQP